MKTIIIADAVMGVDNVLAVAGAAHGSFLLVVLGLLISIPIVVWGSSLVLKLMGRFPVIIYLGAGVLAFTAVKMIVHEPMIKRLRSQPGGQLGPVRADRRRRAGRRLPGAEAPRAATGQQPLRRQAAPGMAGAPVPASPVKGHPEGWPFCFKMPALRDQRPRHFPSRPAPMKQYLDFMRHVYEHGTDKADRTGTGTRSVFGYQMRFDLRAASRWSPPRSCT